MVRCGFGSVIRGGWVGSAVRGPVDHGSAEVGWVGSVWDGECWFGRGVGSVVEVDSVATASRWSGAEGVSLVQYL